MRLGLVGHPIEHSLSPAMHTAAFAALSISASYVLRPTQPREVNEVWGELERGEWHGLNVTTPLKTLFAARAKLDPVAARAGAVNTLWQADGVWHGALTDVEGVHEPLARRGVRGGAGLILGAGGAARAAALALERLGMRVSVAARRPEAARQLLNLVAPAQRGEAIALSGVPVPLLGGVSAVVQATPLGRAGERHPLPWALLPNDAVAFEMLYTPRATPFVRDARARGLAVIEGWEMLLEQGAVALERWTGRAAPREIMGAALLAQL